MVGDIMQNKNNEQSVKVKEEIKEVKTPVNDVVTVPYIVYESEQARSERHIKRLVIAVITAVAMLFISNLVWLYAWCQYDYVSDSTTVSIEGDGDGDANYIGDYANYIGNDGDINGENNSTEKDKDENP